MPSHSAIHVDVRDWDTNPLIVLGDDNNHSIGAVMLSGGHTIWLSGSVEQLDEALLRFGDSIVELRRRLTAREREKASGVSLAARALGEHEAGAA